MSNPAQKAQAPTTAASPEQEIKASPDAETKAPQGKPTVNERSAHQGATESEIMQTLPPTHDHRTAPEGTHAAAEAEIDPADEITPG
jgi:hypothetical protein